MAKGSSPDTSFPPHRLNINVRSSWQINASVLSLSHTHTRWLHLQNCIYTNLRHPAESANQHLFLCSFNYKLVPPPPIMTYFLLPHGQSWRLQIGDDSYTWPRFRLQSNSPLPCITAYHCAITLSEKMVHLTLSPPSPWDSCYLSSHCRFRENTNAWIGGCDWNCQPHIKKKMFKDSALTCTLVAW